MKERLIGDVGACDAKSTTRMAVYPAPLTPPPTPAD